MKEVISATHAAAKAEYATCRLEEAAKAWLSLGKALTAHGTPDQVASFTAKHDALAARLAAL